jgi:hypothetical protein
LPAHQREALVGGGFDPARSSHTDAAHRAVNEILASRSSEYVSRLQKSAG